MKTQKRKLQNNKKSIIYNYRFFNIKIMEEIFLNKFEHLNRAIKTLEYSINESKKYEKWDLEMFNIFRDSVIQRFEYSFELSWKMMKFLGIKIEWEDEVRTVFQAIKMGFRAGYIEDLEKWFEMKDFRNKTSHEYEEDIADDLYYKVSSEYLELMQDYIKNLQEKYEWKYFKFN